MCGIPFLNEEYLIFRDQGEVTGWKRGSLNDEGYQPKSNPRNIFDHDFWS